MANIENLKPIRTKSEARKKGRIGGIKSGEARKEKKMLSQVYSEYLSKKHDINLDGEKLELTGENLIVKVINKILMKADTCSVSLLKEIREVTEHKSNQGTQPLEPIIISFADVKEVINKLDS
jgi:hypothetical protein